MSWFIEAWRPLAGYAFAVRRNDTRDPSVPHPSKKTWLDADEVYAVAPPDFSPLPCASEATALWATRGPFQHKFFQPGGGEFAFESLDQLIELVRRIYLAGGMSQPPTTDIPQPSPPDSPTQPGDWQRILKALDKRDHSTLGPGHDAVRDPDPVLVRQAAQLIEKSMDLHGAALRDLALVLLDALVRARRYGAASTKEHERAWTLLTAEMNEWSRWEDGARNIWHALSQAPHPMWPLSFFWSFTAAPLEDAILNGLIWHVPAPQAPAGTIGARARLTFLGDHLALGLADPRYRRELSSTTQALPLYLCALAIAAAGSSDFRSGVLENGYRSVRARAALWLAEQLPNGEIDVPGAEPTIEQIITLRAGPKPIPGASSGLAMQSGSP